MKGKTQHDKIMALKESGSIVREAIGILYSITDQAYPRVTRDGPRHRVQGRSIRDGTEIHTLHT